MPIPPMGCLAIYVRSTMANPSVMGPSQHGYPWALASTPSGEAFPLRSAPGIVTRTKRSCRGASLTVKKSCALPV
eukprot:7924179-Pyramimonas_sp.AAC.1